MTGGRSFVRAAALGAALGVSGPAGAATVWTLHPGARVLGGYDTNFQALPSPATAEAFVQVAPRLDANLYVGDHSDIHGAAEVSLLRTAPDALTGLAAFGMADYRWIRWSPYLLGLRAYADSLSVSQDASLSHGRFGVAPHGRLPVASDLTLETALLFETTTIGAPLLASGSATDYSYSAILSALVPRLPASIDARATYQFERDLSQPDFRSFVAHHLSVAAGRTFDRLRLDVRFEFARYDFGQSVTLAVGTPSFTPAVHTFKTDLEFRYLFNDWLTLEAAASGLWGLTNVPNTSYSRVVATVGGEIRW